MRGVFSACGLGQSHVVTATVKWAFLPAGILSDAMGLLMIRQNCTALQQLSAFDRCRLGVSLIK
jgi:hypothetical protein